MNPRAEYASRVAARRAALSTLDKQHHTAGYVRVVLALAGLAMIGALILEFASVSAWWLLAPLPFLFLLGQRLQRLEARSAEISRAIAFYHRGIARIEGGWAGTGPSGARFLDEQHVYARDLDLFGDGSLFDLVCNARTAMGEEWLAAWLLAPAPPAEVQSRHGAVRELTPQVDFHEQLAMLPEPVGTGVNSTSLAAWGAQPLLLQSPGLRAGIWLLSCLGLAAVVAAITYLTALFGVVALEETTMSALRAYFLLVAGVIAAVLWRFRTETEQIIHGAEAATTNLHLLAGVLAIIERAPFTSPRWTSLRLELESEGRPPSWRIARLNRLMTFVDMRLNWFVKAIGPLLLFDLHVSFRLEDWRRTSGPAVERWLNVVGEVEAIASLANYHYGRPDHVFPEFVDGPRWFEAEAMGHPLLDAAVTNDVSIAPPLQTLIVSGSNMSGKSTFLRTIGVNVVLAQAGGPVYATRMRLSPLSVAASIRIQDSLREGRSRFYAEILRLRQIMDAAQTRAPALFLIDEFLQGTNSHDRLTGAAAIVRGLVDRGAMGLITTHDLALTQIAESLGPKAGNVHFQDYVKDGELHYDYRLRPGIVSRSNAIELMRSVGLDV
jgi:hypothetical protein